MTPENFAYWLQGFFEMTETNKLSEKQILMIKEHLRLVFDKVTPVDYDQLHTQPVPYWDSAHTPLDVRYCSPAHTCSLDTDTIGFKSTQPKCPQCPDGLVQTADVMGATNVPEGSMLEVHGCNKCSYEFTRVVT